MKTRVKEMVQHTDATTIATQSLWDVNHPESACSLVAWFADFTPLLSVCLFAGDGSLEGP